MKQFLKKIPLLAYFFIGAFLLVVLDFAMKWIVQNNCTPFEPIAVIPNFFYINLSYNTKIAFSWGLEGVGGRILNISISVVMSVAISWYWIKSNKSFKPVMRVIMMLILAGAVGNLIDRAFYWSGTTGFDGVIDFAQFYLGGGPSKAQSWVNPFATFNLADAYLVVGVIMLLIYEIIDMIKNRDRSLEADPRLEQKPAEKVVETEPQNESPEELVKEESHEEDPSK